MAAAESSLVALNALPREACEGSLRACCASTRWAEEVAGHRPFDTPEALYAVADSALEILDEADVDEALAGHPRIGERREGADGAQSRREQSGVDGADADVVAALAEENRQYENRFGHVYLVCATGRSADELLEVLRGRLSNEPATERQVVRRELAAINRIRLARMIGEGS